MKEKIWRLFANQHDGYLSQMDIVYAKMNIGKTILIGWGIAGLAYATNKLKDKIKSRKEEKP